MTAAKFFSQSEIQAIADALGVTDFGLTGTEIDPIIRVAHIPDPDPSLAKRQRHQLRRKSRVSWHKAWPSKVC